MGFIWRPLLPFAKHQQIKPEPHTQIVPQKSRKTGGNTGAAKTMKQRDLAFGKKTFAKERPGTISSVASLPREIPLLLIYSYCYCQRQSPN